MASRNALLASRLSLTVLLLLGAASVARAQSCEPGRSSGPVSLLIVESARKAHDFAATVRNGTVLVRDTTTVIFDDGRVVTSDAEKASAHLNELGWGNRSINVVASFPSRARRWRARAVG